MKRLIIGIVTGLVLGTAGPAYVEVNPGVRLCTESGQKDCSDLSQPQEVPRAWGKLVGVFWSGQRTQMLFEAPDGTLRSVVKNRQTVVRKP